MDMLVTYDVNTLTPEGRRRLRQVARICTGYGQRVQESVFECTVNETQKIALLTRLRSIIIESEDSLRLYVLQGGREDSVECYGLNRYVNFQKSLII